MRTRLASSLSLLLAALFGGVASQAVTHLISEASAQQGRIAEEIRARRFVIEDEKGNPRIVLSVERADVTGKKADAACIGLLGGPGKSMTDAPSGMLITSDRLETSLRIATGGRERLILGVDGQPLGKVIPVGLSTFMVDGKLSTSISTADGGTSGFSVFNQGKPQIYMVSDQKGAPHLAILENGKKVIWEAP